ncbi:carbohydrate ABC transporter permease, partial [Rhizobium johnstonii]
MIIISTTADTSNTAGFVSSRRWLMWSGIAAFCAWVLVPIYLVELGALGGRQGV